MERKVDAIAASVDLMLGELRALQKEIRGTATEEEQLRPALPRNLAHLRIRLERGGREVEDESEMDANFDASRYSISSGPNGHGASSYDQQFGRQQHNGNQINPALDGVPQIHPLLNGESPAAGTLPLDGTPDTQGRAKKRQRSSAQGGGIGGGGREPAKRRATRNGANPAVTDDSGSNSGNSSDASGSRRRAASTTSSSTTAAAAAMAAAAAAAAAAASGQEQSSSSTDPAVQAANSIAGFRPL